MAILSVEPTPELINTAKKIVEKMGPNDQGNRDNPELFEIDMQRQKVALRCFENGTIQFSLQKDVPFVPFRTPHGLVGGGFFVTQEMHRKLLETARI